MKVLRISGLLNLIETKKRKGCISLYNDFKNRFHKSPGSLAKHQAWPGGYIHHLEETMNIGNSLFEKMNSVRKLQFSLSDAMIVLFLHDLEKPFKYVSPIKNFDSHKEELNFIVEMAKKYNIKLTKIHMNALKYIHGENEDYHPTKRIQGPLAAFVHVCDVISARIWFNFPKIK